MATKLKARPPEEVKPGRIKGVLFGPPGSWKSSTATAFPRPYYVDTEGGARKAYYQARLKAAGGVYFGVENGALDFDAIIEQVDVLATEQHPYKTFVIDSLSKVAWNCAAAEQERLGEKDAFGAFKKKAIQKLRKLVAHLERLDMNVWLLCHELTVWEGSGTDRHEAGKAPDTLWDRIPYELDLVLQTRVLGPGNAEASVWQGKSRLSGFKAGDRFYLQNNGVDVSYAAFAERYAKDALEAESKPIVLASPEKIADITRMLEIVKVPEDDIAKWFSKAGVDSFPEFTAEQADGVIAFLNGRLAKKAG